MADLAADVLVPAPEAGRIWTGSRRVRFGDVNPGGRARLDSLSAYVQDVASDDTEAAGVGGGTGTGPAGNVWVVRRAVYEVHRAARFLEDLTLTTWCSGLGRRWGERRVSMHGSKGAHIEAALLWVTLDLETGRPVPIGDDFDAGYREAAGGREVSARLQHPNAVPDDPAVRRMPWSLRATDFDLLDHVNNAASFAMVEQVIAHHDRHSSFRAEVEYRVPVESGCEVELAILEDAGGMAMWALARPAGHEPGAPPIVATTARLLLR